MKKGSLIFIILLFGFLYFYKLGSYRLFDVDEPRYAESAREMIESGNWITPTLNYEPRLDKPVLFYWLIGISYKIFGINEFSARFFSALAGFGLIVFTFIFVRRSINLITAIISSLILGTSLHIFLQSHFSITDMTLTFFISSSLFFFYLGYISESIWLYISFYIMMGFAVLTKGPLGIVLPLLIIGGFFVLTGNIKNIKDIRNTIRDMHSLIGVAIFLIVVLPWYILVIGENGLEYINYFFIKNNIIRYLKPLSGHSAPIFFYIPVIFTGLLPWGIYLPVAIRKFFPFKFHINKNKEKISLDIIKKDIDKVLIFLMIWAIITFIFFSISKTKLVTYILSIYPPLSIIIGRLIERALFSDSKIDIKKSEVILGIIFIVFYYIIMPFSIIIFEIIANIYVYKSIFFSILIIILSSLLLKNIHDILKLKFFVINSILSIILLFTVADAYLPIINYYRQNDLYEFSIKVRNDLPYDGNIIMFDIDKPTIIFYTKRRVERIYKWETEKLKDLLRKPSYIITKRKYLKRLSPYKSLHIIDKRKKYILLSNRRKFEK